MSPLEISISLFSCLLIGGFFISVQAVRFTRSLYVGMLGTIFLQIVTQGPYWHLIPLYLAFSIASFRLFNIERSFVPQIVLAFSIISLAVTSASFSVLLPLFRLPAPTGHFATATRVLHFVDLSRPDSGHQLKSGHRELMVQAWYPIDAAQGYGTREPYRRLVEVTRLSSYMTVIRTNSFSGKAIASTDHEYPVLLFNPAWKGQRTECEYLMEDLASHGFVVIGIDHTYNSGPVTFPDGTRILSTPGLDIDDFHGRGLAAQQGQGYAEVRVEAQDDSFVLDELMHRKMSDADSWYKKLNLQRVGTIGHSFGGAVALQSAYSDSRVVSAINMDGWTFGDPSHIILRKPTMQMDEDITWPTNEEVKRGDHDFKLYWQLSADDARFRQVSIATSGGYHLVIIGSKHMDFADRSLYSPIKSWTDSGMIMPQHAHNIIRQYVYAFFSQTLRGEKQPLLEQRDSSEKEVIFQKFTASTLIQ